MPAFRRVTTPRRTKSSHHQDKSNAVSLRIASTLGHRRNPPRKGKSAPWHNPTSSGATHARDIHSHGAEIVNKRSPPRRKTTAPRVGHFCEETGKTSLKPPNKARTALTRSPPLRLPRLSPLPDAAEAFERNARTQQPAAENPSRQAAAEMAGVADLKPASQPVPGEDSSQL